MMTPPASSTEPPTKRIRLSGLPGEAARTQQACTACRERKIKCCGNQPCRYCSKRSLDCRFVDAGRKKMYSVAYVEDLEKRAVSAGADAAYTDCLEPQNLSPEIDAAQMAPTSNTSPIVSEPTMSSSLDFGTRIRGLTVDSRSPHLHTIVLSHETPDNAYDLEPDGTSKHRDRSGGIRWPSEEEALGLLQSVITSIGSVQHLIDPRSFSDRLSSFYEEEISKTHTIDLGHVEMLMVFALGGLLQGRLKEGSTFPGAEYFLEAVSSLPSLCTLRKAGVQAIEVMGLFAFFLQCSDRKDDAYIYAGVALRLAISNGLARDSSYRPMKRSEKVHRNRLWWTIYMQERRLAAATGNPVGILDDNISTSFPSESAGFTPVAALSTNIQLARMTGRIVQSVYNCRHQSERQFLNTIQKLVADLTSLNESLPPECTVELSNPTSLTRTSATLNLMFSQAMILTTRPLLLHLAKSRLDGVDLNSALTGIPTLHKLATTCIEAAGASLDILRLLKHQKLIAKFGFFDLDAAVSSAFVFVLVESIYSTESSHPGIQGIKGARDVLRYLSHCGNRAAEKRLHDVQQLCEHLSISLDPTVPRVDGDLSESIPSSVVRQVPAGHINDPTSTSDRCQSSTSPNFEDLDWRQALASFDTLGDSFNSLEMDHNILMDSTASDQFDGFNFDLSGDFLLTGAEETDWEQFERQIMRNNE